MTLGISYDPDWTQTCPDSTLDGEEITAHTSGNPAVANQMINYHLASLFFANPPNKPFRMIWIIYSQSF